MAILTSGRTEPCKDNVGGIKRIFIFPYVDYSYTQIVGTRGVVVTSFPATDIYEFAIVKGSMNETAKKDDNGLSYAQTTKFSLVKQDFLTTHELTQLEKKELRYIVELNNGTYRICGLFNGAKFGFDTNSGGSKSDFNGYNCTFESEEEWQAAYITNLSDAGFTVINVLLLEDFDPLLFESGELITLE